MLWMNLWIIDKTFTVSGAKKLYKNMLIIEAYFFMFFDFGWKRFLRWIYTHMFKYGIWFRSKQYIFFWNLKFGLGIICEYAFKDRIKFYIDLTWPNRIVSKIQDLDQPNWLKIFVNIHFHMFFLLICDFV